MCSPSTTQGLCWPSRGSGPAAAQFAMGLPVASVASCRSDPLLESPSLSHPQSTSVHYDCSAALPVPTTVEVQERVSSRCTVAGTVPACLDSSHEQPAPHPWRATAKGDGRNGPNLKKPLHCPTCLGAWFTADGLQDLKREAIYTPSSSKDRILRQQPEWPGMHTAHRRCASPGPRL
jgi:hypothetical protein